MNLIPNIIIDSRIGRNLERRAEKLGKNREN
jgi:hypothetical protein